MDDKKEQLEIITVLSGLDLTQANKLRHKIISTARTCLLIEEDIHELQRLLDNLWKDTKVKYEKLTLDLNKSLSDYIEKKFDILSDRIDKLERAAKTVKKESVKKK